MLVIKKIGIEGYFKSEHEKEMKRLALVGKKLDDFTFSCHFGLQNTCCTVRVAERGSLYFAITKTIGENQEKGISGIKVVMKEIKITQNFLKEVDSMMSKFLGKSLEGKGHIYLVSDGENTKIGATTYNPEKRLNELQVGNAKKLTLIGSYQVGRRIATESLLHASYGAKNIRGEWFKLSGNDVVDILNNRTQSSNNEEYQTLTAYEASSLEYYLWYVQDQWIKYSEKIRLRCNGKSYPAFQTRITGKGQVYFEKKYRVNIPVTVTVNE